MKKTEAQFKKYLMTVINRFVPMLLLQRHTFEVKRQTDVEHKDALMTCIFNYPYLNVTICYSRKAFLQWQEGKDMTPYVVHEMCHPITDPLYAKATSRWTTHADVTDERENLTDLICNIVLKLSGNV